MPEPEQDNLQETISILFRKVNVVDMPAMSANVQELLAILGSKESSVAQATEAILKDFSLTSKILQVVNSAYYSRGNHIGSISRAVTFIGFNTIRELATAVALFDDFVKKSREKDNLAKVLAKSFLSAIQVKILCETRKLPVPSEDAFICSLLYNLGKIIVIVYLPDQYDRIVELISSGASEKRAARAILDDLTFHQIGRAIAKHWKFADNIINTMTDDPVYPKSIQETELYLQNLVVFCNSLTFAVCHKKKIFSIMDRFGPLFLLDKTAALELVEKSAAISNDMSEVIHHGLALLHIQEKIDLARKPASSSRY